MNLHFIMVFVKHEREIKPNFEDLFFMKSCSNLVCGVVKVERGLQYKIISNSRREHIVICVKIMFSFFL